MSIILGWPQDTQATGGVGFDLGHDAAPRMPRDPVVDPSEESHWLCVAPTGAGKTSGFAIPQLLTHPGAAVVLDVKGELHAVTARYRRELGEVLVLDPFDQVGAGGQGFNPLAHLDPDAEDFVDDLFALAALFSNQRPGQGAKDPFWDEAAQNLIAAVIGASIQTVQKRDGRRATLGDVAEIFGAENLSYRIAELLDCNGDGFHAFTRSALGNFCSTTEVTRSGIAATASQQVRMIAGEGMRRVTSADTGAVDRLEAGAPVTVYVVMRPDKLASHAGFVRIVMSAIMQRLLRRRRRPGEPTLFLIDEATQVGQMDMLRAAVTLGRGYGIRTAMMVQSLAQLKGVYSEESTALIENCSLMAMGALTNFGMARALAETGFGDVTAATLAELQAGEVMVKAASTASRRLDRLNYRLDALFQGRFDPNPFYDEHQPQLELAF